MSALLPRPSVDENISTTLSAGITDVATSFDVADASKLVHPCYLVIDRVDSAGTQKATSLWEYVKVTNISSNTLTVTRGQGGSTAQAHSSGAVVEAVVTSSMFEDWYAVLNPEHDSTGGHVISHATVVQANIASSATIADASFHTINVSSTASINTIAVTGNVLIGGSTIARMTLNPVWFAGGIISGATTGVGGQLVMPRPGTFRSVSHHNALGASGSSILVDVNKNGTSIFDTVGRPVHAAAGTFVSTASIKTKTFTTGDTFTVDIDAGQAGMWVKDLTIQAEII